MAVSLDFLDSDAGIDFFLISDLDIFPVSLLFTFSPYKFDLAVGNSLLTRFKFNKTFGFVKVVCVIFLREADMW